MNFTLGFGVEILRRTLSSWLIFFPLAFNHYTLLGVSLTNILAWKRACSAWAKLLQTANSQSLER
ncbi:hypothetical protein BJX62DRAFT_221382 [Aspergillus germanicus]